MSTSQGTSEWASLTPWSPTVFQSAWLMDRGALPQHPRSSSHSSFRLPLSSDSCTEMSTGEERCAVNKQKAPAGSALTQPKGFFFFLNQSRRVISFTHQKRKGDPELLCTLATGSGHLLLPLVSGAGLQSSQRQTLVSLCGGYRPVAVTQHHDQGSVRKTAFKLASASEEEESMTAGQRHGGWNQRLRAHIVKPQT